MPEYLAPGVYMEEFEIGAKPIEGVSTSTAGFLGMTERGPMNRPTFVTSFAEYERIFGEYLKEEVYKEYRFLPYSVEGFFANGGQRVFISRVADMREKIKGVVNENKATCASGFLPNITGITTTLAEDVKLKATNLKIKDVSTLSKDDILFLRDGPQSEYLKVFDPAIAKRLTLKTELKNSYDTTKQIQKMKKSAEIFTIDKKVEKDATQINLNKDINNSLDVNDALFIEDANKSEICIIKSIPAAKTIEVYSPLQEHETTVGLKKCVPWDPEIKKNLIKEVLAGNTVIFIESDDASFSKPDIIKIGDEYFIVDKADDNIVLIEDGLRYSHDNGKELQKLEKALDIKAANEGSWGNDVKVIIKESSILKTKLDMQGPKNVEILDLASVIGIEEGTILKINIPDQDPIYSTVKTVIKTDVFKRVELDQNVIIPQLASDQKVTVETSEFDLIVRSNKFEELFKNLSLSDKHSRYVKKRITHKTSNLIKIEKVYDSNLPQKLVLEPTKDDEPSWKLNNGNDGIPQSDADGNEIYGGNPSTEPEKRTGLYTLQNIDDISIVAIPGITTQELQSKLIILCDNMKDRFAVLDSEPSADLSNIQDQSFLYDSKYAALYYPWISVFDPSARKRTNVPPSGYVCGIYARSDTERGVHKAPANEVVKGALDLEELNGDGSKRIITKGQQDILNPKGVNCIRAMPGRGIRVWGARTISKNSLWKYVNVRRLFIYVEESIEKSTQWVVFEPNDEKLWARVRATITQFLTRVWRDGALMGTKVEEAFFVKCDRTTMTQDDIDNGRLICVIGIAPVRPAEFVIFRIAQWQGGSSATE